jgi:hypothetical protein
MFVPLFLDSDEDPIATSERDFARNEAAQMDRLRNNPRISATEFEAMNSSTTGGNGLPPRPAPGELEKQREAEKAAR